MLELKQLTNQMVAHARPARSSHIDCSLCLIGLRQHLAAKGSCHPFAYPELAPLRPPGDTSLNAPVMKRSQGSIPCLGSTLTIPISHGRARGGAEPRRPAGSTDRLVGPSRPATDRLRWSPQPETRRQVIIVVASAPSTTVGGVVKMARSPSRATWRTIRLPTSDGSTAPSGVSTKTQANSSTS